VCVHNPKTVNLKRRREIMTKSTVDNNGIGALYGTFDIYNKELSNEDIGKAVTLIGPNAVGLGKIGDVLLGMLEHTSNDLAIVQMCGVVRVPISLSCVTDTWPKFKNFVMVDGRGGVFATETCVGRGMILAVSEETCDVLL